MSMSRRLLILSLLISFSVLAVSLPSAVACRLYVAIGEQLTDEQIGHDLIRAPYSVRNLGHQYDDGWSISLYKDGKGAVFRGHTAANLDAEFPEVVRRVTDVKPNLVMAHLRKASSGCLEGVPNPHPFKHSLKNKEFLFAHNGGMPKKLLMELIGADYLADHLPKACTYDPPHSWIDSELYFIYLLKKIDENKGDVYLGLREGLRTLYQNLPKDRRYLNFLLTDGQRVWAFRKGHDLYYRYDELSRVTTVTSTVPSGDETGWLEFPEDAVGFIFPNQDVRFLHIMSDLTH
jgi:predicted glutamine amidotransferase